MQKLIITLGLIIAALLAMVKCASAAEPEVYYKGGLSFDAFGAVRTPDLQKSRGGVGVGLNYYFDANFGVGAEAIQENFGHNTLDEANLYLLYRVPVDKTAFYVFAGGGRQFDAGRYGVLFGGGIERKISDKVSLFGDARLTKIIDRDAGALGRLGIRFSW